MSQILHIKTHADDSLIEKVLAEQGKDVSHKIEVVDLSKGQVDYKVLLEKIFAADSVQVW